MKISWIKTQEILMAAMFVAIAIFLSWCLWDDVIAPEHRCAICNEAADWQHQEWWLCEDHYRRLKADAQIELDYPTFITHGYEMNSQELYQKMTEILEEMK